MLAGKTCRLNETTNVKDWHTNLTPKMWLVSRKVLGSLLWPRGFRHEELNKSHDSVTLKDFGCALCPSMLKLKILLQHWNLFILCLRWCRGDDYFFLCPHAISLCPFFFDWKLKRNSKYVFKCTQLLQYLVFKNSIKIYSINMYKLISKYLKTLSLSKTSLTSSLETKKEISTREYFLE